MSSNLTTGFKSSSWIYLFSKFTPEALLFESLAIFLVLAAYAAYWVLHKRKEGAANADVPASVVKEILNKLILDAEQLRMQLFGLLSAAGLPQAEAARLAAAIPAPGATVTQMVADPALFQKITLLEGKMTEQQTAMQAIVAEKAKLEQALAAAKAAAPKGADGGNSAQLKELQDKTAMLEAKLAEYSVIEDDLANLKRLQQENAELKAALANGGGSVAPKPQTEAAPAPAAPEKKAAAEPAAAAPASAPAAGPASNPSDLEDAFEKLVDHVEESLQPASAAPETAAAAATVNAEAAPAPAASTSTKEADATTIPENATATPAAAAPPAKSDDDLVAEFERMLSS